MTAAGTSSRSSPIMYAAQPIAPDAGRRAAVRIAEMGLRRLGLRESINESDEKPATASPNDPIAAK